MSEYKFDQIEKHWQQYWRDNNIYKVEDDTSKPKFYVLDMFPYPSGAGLHVGHPLGYIASDIYARYKRLNGFNVLHPMGYDSFGLPAEQYAIQTGQHPAITTEQNINRYREQMDMLGFSFDWSRQVKTSEPEFYKWTQWIFIKLYHSWYNTETNRSEGIETLVEKLENQTPPTSPEGRLVPFPREMRWKELSEKKQEEILMQYRNAYLSESYVNWCPALGTVLANDEVKDGVSERGGHPVERKLMMQWSMRITSYADRLLQGLDKIDWPEPLKETQRNWIGKSSGSSVRFDLSPALSGGEGVSTLRVEEEAGYYHTNPNVWKKSIVHAKDMRKNPTEAEEKFWKCVKADRVGYKFRRQHPIGVYIPDFVCLKKRLIVEIDGDYHNDSEQKLLDEQRTNSLIDKGFKIIRFTNDDIINDIDNVVKLVKSELDNLPNIDSESPDDHIESPSPQGENATFPLGEGRGGVEVFTTRPDTIFGATFVTLAPENNLVDIITTAEYKTQVAEYIHYAKSRSERERQADVKKITGQFTGAYVIHPFTGEDIPVWIGDYVLAGYGTGAVMGVPAHDSRDYAFAKHFGLPIKQVIKPNTDWDFEKESYDEKVGTSINSAFLNGLEVKDAIQKAIEEIEELGIGKGKTNFRLRDAIFGRQRYWGEPIPIYYKDGIPYTMDEKDLPLVLPEVDKYLPTEDGEPPLARAKDWAYRPLSNSPLRGEDQSGGLSESFLQKDSDSNSKSDSDMEMGRIYKTADPVFYGIIKEFSKSNRENPTLAEEVLWKQLKGEKLGVKFRRQHIIRNYIADFVCLERKLVIEVDGGYHTQIEQKEYDKYRDEIINNEGFEVLRFTNDEIYNHKASIIEKIKNAIATRPINSQKNSNISIENTTSPSPLRGELERGSYPLETTTMPGWAGSSWYMFRYMDPHNTGEFASKKALDYWKDVDVYIGGSEHGTGHLLYVRYWTKFLYDMGLLPVDEPAKKLINQGMIQGVSLYICLKSCQRINDSEKDYVFDEYYASYNLPVGEYEHNSNKYYISKNAALWRIPIDQADAKGRLYENSFRKLFGTFIYNPIIIHRPVSPNDDFDFDKGVIWKIDEDGNRFIQLEPQVEKMSKSKWNVVNPDEIVSQYGADTLRLYEMFLGPLEQSKPWNTQGIEGVHRFLKKLWGLFYNRDGNYIVTDEEPNAAELKILHRTIKKAGEDVEGFSFNTSVSAFMICVNELLELNCHKKNILEQLLIIVSPYAPHICEELWHTINPNTSIIKAEWPIYNAAYLVENTFQYPVSVNGKLRLTLELALDLEQADVEKAVMQHEVVRKWTEGKEPKKIVFVKGRIVNVVV